MAKRSVNDDMDGYVPRYTTWQWIWKEHTRPNGISDISRIIPVIIWDRVDHGTYSTAALQFGKCIAECSIWNACVCFRCIVHMNSSSTLLSLSFGSEQ